MEPERWGRVEELFHAALAYLPGERPAFLAQACSGDKHLRRQLELLLASAEAGAAFLETPALKVAAQELARDPAQAPFLRESDLLSQPVSRYMVIEALGRG